MKYHDKNGKEIKPGMIIQHDNGDKKKVFAGEDGELGFNASNPNYIGYNPFNLVIYPLHQFDLNEWSIIDDK